MAGSLLMRRPKLSRVGSPGYLGIKPYALSLLYEHVGHDVTYYLKDTDVLASGGFSTDPGGNTVEIVFTPLDGTPIGTGCRQGSST